MQLSFECAKLLADTIRNHPILEYITLFGNKLGDAGAQALSEAIACTNCLVWLDLSTGTELP
jgi:hypothetical protein